MWRVLTTLLLIAGGCGVGMLVVWFGAWLLRKAQRDERQDAIDHANAEWLAKLSREDIARHRERMNRNIDEQWKEQ